MESVSDSKQNMCFKLKSYIDERKFFLRDRDYAQLKKKKTLNIVDRVVI